MVQRALAANMHTNFPCTNIIPTFLFEANLYTTRSNYLNHFTILFINIQIE